MAHVDFVGLSGHGKQGTERICALGAGGALTSAVKRKGDPGKSCETSRSVAVVISSLGLEKKVQHRRDQFTEFLKSKTNSLHGFGAHGFPLHLETQMLLYR